MVPNEQNCWSTIWLYNRCMSTLLFSTVKTAKPITLLLVYNVGGFAWGSLHYAELSYRPKIVPHATWHVWKEEKIVLVNQFSQVSLSFSFQGKAECVCVCSCFQRVGLDLLLKKIWLFLVLNLYTCEVQKIPMWANFTKICYLIMITA